MELYILDSRLRRTAVVDRFESLIWTERYTAWGDFELVIYSTSDSKSLFAAGTRLSMSDSYSVMTVEFVEDKVDSEGRQLLHVSGRSLESLLDERVARNTFADLTTVPKWVLTGTPASIMRQVFNAICRDNVNFEDDEIPFLMPGSIFPPSNIPEPDENITVELDLTTVYNVLKEMGSTYNLGFRLIRNFDESELYFDVYSGNDRTLQQTVLDPVVFSPELDNLTNTSEITSVTDYKNVAYVFHTSGVQVVTADGVNVEIDGFARRVMPVDASDITIPERPYDLTTAQQESINAGIALITSLEEHKNALQKLLDKVKLSSTDIMAISAVTSSASLTTAQKADITAAKDNSVAYDPTETAWLNNALVQKGKAELAKSRSISAFDGELPFQTGYTYELDYQLGDLVEMHSANGVTNHMRVTEQIFVSDGEGERSYPTLIIDLFITPGSWYAYDYNGVWLTAEGTWGDLGEPEEGPISTAPAAPAIPTVTSQTTASIVSWIAPSSGGSPIYEYDVQYSTSPTFTSATTLVTSAVTLTIVNQTPITAYSYRIRARNSIGVSGWSPVRTVSTKSGILVSAKGPAGTRMTIPGHISPSGGQTTHPSVVDFGISWNGYRYWMSHTPYPGGSDAAEDPNIVASHDGTTWVIPAGLTNPLDDQPGSPGAYNSDSDLVYGPDGYLWLFWRTYTASATGTEERLYIRRSNDGVTWTPKVLIWQTAASEMRLVSPTFVFENGAWTMWAINILNFTLCRVRSSNATLTSPSSWGTPATCSLPSTGAGRQPWHIEIRKIDNIYIGMLNDRPNGLAPGGDLYMIRSLDGVNWTLGSGVAIPRSGGTSPGHQNLYRSTFTKKTDTTLDVWYSAWNNTPTTVWNVFRTTIA